MSIKTRLKKIENTVYGEKGISQWAMEVAQNKAFSESLWYEFEMNFYEQMNLPKPEPPELETETDIENYARNLTEKYSSKEDYEKSLPPPDYSGIDKIINKKNQ